MLNRGGGSVGQTTVTMLHPDMASHFRSEHFKSKQFAAYGVIQRALQGAKRPLIAFSGGKDSLAVLALVHAVDPTVPLLWSDDELEYPETVEYLKTVRELAGDHMIVTLGHALHANWFRPWRNKPFHRDPLPGALHIGTYVERWQAAQGYDLVFTGLRAGESRARRRNAMFRGDTYDTATGMRCTPVMDWTADDVWAMIAGLGLPYNRVYDILHQIGVAREGQRVGPLPLSPRHLLAAGWPYLLEWLEQRYGPRWE